LPQLLFAWFAAAAFAASLGFFLYSYLFVFGPAPSASVPALSASVPALSAVVSAPSVINLAMFTAFALHHSLFARTGVKDAVKRIVPPALERAVYTLVASVLFALVCWWWQPLDGVAWRLTGAWRWPGYGAQLAGIVLTIVGARALDVWELAGVRQVSGTAGDDRAVTLKTDGLYGFVRHPLYFAWVLLVFGAPDMTMTRLSFAVISTAYLAAAIPFEERSLVETFGPDYASYRMKVRWRMIPGLY
jgi:protein-S-isoprenylcysteine O-methyltransferase Ste14